MMAALRVVAWFWSAVALLALLGVAVLGRLGPVPAPYHMPAVVTAAPPPLTGTIPPLAGATPPSTHPAAPATPDATPGATSGADLTIAPPAPAPASLAVAPLPSPAAPPATPPPLAPTQLALTPPEPTLLTPAAIPPAAAPPIAAPPATMPADLHIADPLPALLRPSTLFPGHMLPIKAAGLLPMRVYARPFDAADPRPRVAILIDGFGLADTVSLEAMRRLPGPVDLVFSAYAPDPGPIAEAARASGHEFLVSVPMEPRGYPQDDEGFRSLLVDADPSANQQSLDWSLSRVQGYVGATAASDGLRGEHFAQSGRAYTRILAQIAQAGLLYIDPRPSARLPASVPGRAIDLVLDQSATAEQIDIRLAALERTAKERGAAIGLAGPLRPLTIERIALWAKALDAHGVVLAPVSAIAGSAP